MLSLGGLVINVTIFSDSPRIIFGKVTEEIV